MGIANSQETTEERMKRLPSITKKEMSVAVDEKRCIQNHPI